ncbi:MAG: tyrosine--tRNA ligase [Methanomassiliicoccales archaeon]|nr:MAG: tyrosine--tRNA ligase [Methanomassiliicoccales archaeon]
MDLEDRFQLVARNAEEIVTPEDLRHLLATKERPVGYIGFEPSGLVHIGWMVCSQKVKNMIDANFDMIIFLADWHAYLNDKLGGDINNIRTCAEYMKDCFEALGVPRDKVRFKLASEIMDITYWEKVMKIGKVSSLTRVKRALTIMGRNEDEAEMDSSKTLYPLMQAADIFQMDVDVAYAGMDQRKAHMLAREAADRLRWKKAVALHTPLIAGLKGGNRMDPLAAKMSKSDPDSGILIHDTPEEIRRKISKAFCPPEVEGNPVLQIAKFILFERVDKIAIRRPEKFGGDVEFTEYADLEAAYLSGKVHPMDLKNNVAEALADTLAPVRDYFARKPENYEKVKEIVAGLKALR